VIVVSDSTILIGLMKIRKLDLLQKLFTIVYVPTEVFEEVTKEGHKKIGSMEIKEALWINVRPIEDRTEADLLLTTLDKGEAESLVLAKEMRADLLLLDEKKARKVAAGAGFTVMGVAGILLLAKNLGLIQEIKPLFEELRRAKFRISENIMFEILKKAGEKSSGIL